MRWRFVAAFAGVMVVVLLAVGVPLSNHLHDVETERLVAELQRDAFVIGGAAEDVLSGQNAFDPVALQSTIDLYGSTEGADVVIVARDGTVAAASGGGFASGEDVSSLAEVAAALTGSPVSGRAGEIYVAVPVRNAASVVGAVRISYPAGSVEHRVNDKVRGLVIVGLISLAASVIAAVFMAGTVVGPLRRLQRSTETVASGDFSGRADVDDGPPEIRSLARSFNTTTAQVATLVEQQRSFASDASHQLRTPLTALRLQVERAGEMIDTDPDAAHGRIEAATAEIERMQQMVEGLLLLARGTSSVAPTGAVDVSSVAAERTEVWRALADERDVGLVARIEAGCWALAVDGAVEQIVDNFIDNAINVAPAGSTIEIAAGRRDGWVEVHVLDRGPGLSDEQLAHAFDRFWRAPTAAHEGSGLGLAIVRHLATKSNGDVDLTNRIGGGIDARLRLRPATEGAQPSS